jgi:hypothetical protein
VIAGHFGLAAAVKARARPVPLWALMLATAWLDVVFVPLLAAGAESIDTASHGGGYGGAVIHADYTHSLLGALVLAAVFGLVAARRCGRRSGAVLGGVAFSHWLLDLVVHRADMPFLPGDLGGLPRLGLGLWEAPAVSAGVELALVVAGAVLYWRAASRAARVAGPGRGRPALTGAAVLLAGVATLSLDLLGM